MKRLLAAFALAFCAASLYAQNNIVFAYFKEPGDQGIYFALSHDGYTFTPPQ